MSSVMVGVGRGKNEGLEDEPLFWELPVRLSPGRQRA